MKLIVDILENDYELALRNDYSAIYKGTHIAEAIKKGTPLPKGHGRLKDVDWDEQKMWDLIKQAMKEEKNKEG